MDIHSWPTYIKIFCPKFFLEKVGLKNTLPTYSLDICSNFHSFFVCLFLKASLCCLTGWDKLKENLPTHNKSAELSDNLKKNSKKNVVVYLSNYPLCPGPIMPTKTVTNQNNQWVPSSLRKEWQIHILKRFLRVKESLIFDDFIVIALGGNDSNYIDCIQNRNARWGWTKK